MKFCTHCAAFYNDVCPEHGEAVMRDAFSEEPYAITTPLMDAVLRGDFKPVDDVNHPKHYSRWKMEPIEFIAINDLPWWLANVIKYTMRFDAKDGLKDLYKARSYLDMKIRQLEGEKRFWDAPVKQERELNGK